MTADIWSLIDTAGPAALDRGPRAGVAAAATLERALAPHLAGMTSERRAAALALALLWHDDLDGAHQLCQAHEDDADCNYVHALLHRREGDFANAKYWFREVGTHPAYVLVARAAAESGYPTLVTGGVWRPAAMVDACAAAVGDDPAKQTALLRLQAAEFRALGTHLFALGG